MFHGSSGFAGGRFRPTHEYPGLPRLPAQSSLQTIDPRYMKWELLPFSFVIPPSGGVVTSLDWWLMQPLHWGETDE